ncbi:MAG TPA: glycosyltransferase [Tepidisphaeraceae bacterium]|nr:glycosyltransferase [Tepidisphaeraceae bacterium]
MLGHLDELVVVIYIAVLTTIAIYGFHRYVLVYLYLKYKHEGYLPKSRFDTLPKITVQLPMFNEHSVAERIIRATCAIDYPRDRLEIQVLDDSTDESAEIARKTCQEMAKAGVNIQFIHRDNRVGYKAGALAEGMKTASGEFLAIFDADFVPPCDILHNVVDYFTDDKIGMVQVRWDHLNRDASLLTKSQAIFLDGHFVIEHTARNRSGRFMHFNGTAGVWRRNCIDDAGGWHHDTLTEDLDLSYRAQLKGWQFVYLPQFCAPAELPPEMIGFKQQAHRWTKGSMQTCIKLLPRILKSRLPLHVKTEAFFHLTNTIVYVLMVILTILMYPCFLSLYSPFNHFSGTWSQYLFTTSLFVLATCSTSTFFVFGQKELFGSEGGWKTVYYMPILMALGVGVSLNNCKAVCEAIWGAIRGRQSAVFVRTQKYGTSGHHGKVWGAKSLYTLKRLALPIVEIAFGIYMSCWILISLYYQFCVTAVPFLGMFAGGFFYVGFSSLYTLYCMQRDRTAPVAPVMLPAPVESIST